MNSSKMKIISSRIPTSSNHFSADKLRQIIKNVRRAADNFIVRSDDAGGSSREKFSNAGEPFCESSQGWSVSCRRPTEHEIDKLMQRLTSAKSCDAPDRQSVLAIVVEQQVEPEEEAPIEIPSGLGNLELEIESEISFGGSSASLAEAELPADVEDNLTYSGSSRPSSAGAEFHRTVSGLALFSEEPSREEMEQMTVAIRTIEPGSEGTESYCETSPDDRPIMQVTVRPLPASHHIRRTSLNVPPADLREPLIDFAQIERSTKLRHARANMLLHC
uniref:Uncharacterized protein n=1 Tax=Anopheles atroparvus TaxID=41427 RepID=A0AAG5DP36_ANOAO